MTNNKKYKVSEKYGTVFGDLAITPVGRINYPSLKERSQKYQKYSFTIQWKKDEVDKNQFTPMINACKELIVDTFGNAKPPVFSFPPIKDGNTPVDGKPGGKFPGFYYINVASDNPIFVVEQKGNQAVPLTDLDRIKAGVLVKAKVQANLFKQNAAFVGFSWKAQILLCVKDDGVYFAAGQDPSDMLDVLAEENESDSSTIADSFDTALSTPAAPVKPSGIVAGIDIL